MTCATLLRGLDELAADTPDARMRVFSGGEGPQVVLVHGLGGGAATWVEVVDRLLPRHRVLAVDLPGHGGSQPPPRGVGVAWYADAVAAAMDGAGATPAVVVGHSFGAQIVARLVERHPRHATGAVLVGPCGVTPLARRTRALAFVSTLVRPGARVAPLGARLAGRAWFRRLVFGLLLVEDPVALSARAVEGFFCELREHRDVRTARRAIFADEPIATSGPFPCRTIALWGERDGIVPLDHGRTLARRSGAELRVVADCGHMAIGERAGAVADAVASLAGA
jgi:pimeloyl-ACP methyl ester carboxylesterase